MRNTHIVPKSKLAIVMTGWIKIHRSFLTWEWFDKPEMVQVFVYLLLKANHDAKEWHGMTIERGQIVTSVAKIAQETRLSVRTVRTCLDRLKTTNEVTITTTTKFTLITISKYDTYQDGDNASDKAFDKVVDNPTANERQTNDKQTTTNKNDKNIRREEDSIYTHTQFIDLVKFLTCACASTPEQVQELAEVVAAVQERVERDADAARMWGELPLVTKAFVWNWVKHNDLMMSFDSSMSYECFEKMTMRYDLDDVTMVIKEMANKIASAGTRLSSFETTFETYAVRNYVIQEKKRLGNPKYN